MAIIPGTSRDDVLAGTADADEINGLQGNDTINGAAGDDVIRGGNGNDILDGEAGFDSVFGGDGNDTLTSLDRGVLDGGSGNDKFLVAFNNRTVDLFVHGGSGHDSFASFYAGQNSLDYIRSVDFYGDSGNDTFTFYRTQSSLMDGGSGNDDISIQNMLSGEIYGGSGNDRIDLYQMLGVVSGDAGNDVITIANAKAISRIYGGDGHDVMSVGFGSAVMDGGAGNDYLFNGLTLRTIPSQLLGGDGHDTLKSPGLDVLDGGEGRDVLESGALENTLTGGEGADLFVYGGLVNVSSPNGIRPDIITDFDRSDRDLLDVSTLLSPVVDPVAGGWLGVESVSGGSALLFDRDGGGDNFVQLAILQGVTLTLADIGVIIIT